jgi:small subunit ribosomal protein S7e
MFTARTKIQKEKGKGDPSPLEEQIAQLIFELQTNSTADFKQELQDLYFTAAKEVDAGAGKKAVVVFVPFRLAKEFHRIQAKLVRELEKKLSGKQVVIIAQRRILPKSSRNSRVARQQRPRSRTLTAVHDAILEDLVYPTEIVGKRTRVRLDGSKVIKMFVYFALIPCFGVRCSVC